MLFSEAKPGRVFVIRLEDGDVIHEEIEKFAINKSINAASMIILGGADKSSILITGPENGRAEKIIPQQTALNDVHEITGTGTLFPDENGKPQVHMHIACGRSDKTVTGCIREGVKTWQVIEIILYELVGSGAKRLLDETTGFKLLIP